MSNAFNFGQFLRNRYADFFDTIYNKNKVYVRSTDFDRTLMTAQCLLAGLYSPVDYQVWNDSIKWQPIPVHTSDVKNDLVNKKCID